MLNAFGYLSCFKLCWYNRPGPNSARPVSIAMALLLQAPSQREKISNLPPLAPKGGEIYNYQGESDNQRDMCMFDA